MFGNILKALNDDDLEVAKKLIFQLEDVNSRDVNGVTCLYMAASHKHHELVELILDRGADPNLPNSTGSTPLLRASSFGRTASATLLLKKGADPNLAKNTGTTPLLRAAKNGYLEIVDLLLDNGADPNQPNHLGTTPLIAAANWGRTNVVVRLISAGASVDLQDQTGSTAIMRAAMWGKSDIIDILVKAEADVSLCDNEGNQAITLAARMGMSKAVMKLIQVGARLDVRDSDGDSPLILAARQGKLATVKLLLSQIDKNTFNPTQTGLMLNEAGEILPKSPTCLMEETTEIFNFKDHSPEKGLHPQIPNHQDVHEIGNFSEDPDDTGPQVGPNIETIIFQPYSENSDDENSEILENEEVIDNDLEHLLDESESYGGRVLCDAETALMEAAKGGHYDVIEILLQRLTDPNCKNDVGQTPLMLSASNGHTAIVELLLKSGSNPEIKDNFGNTALILASRNGNAEVVRILQSCVTTNGSVLDLPEIIKSSSANERLSIPPDRPLQLDQLAVFLMNQLGEPVIDEILKECAPAGAKGTAMERLLETLHEADLKEFVKQCLGHGGIIMALNKMRVVSDENSSVSPVANFLGQFGIRVPLEPKELGAEHAIIKLRRLECVLAQAKSEEKIRGGFFMACETVERLVKLAVWGWAQLAFPEDRDERLMKILQPRRKRPVKLDKLSFGDIVTLFDYLPEEIAASPSVSIVSQKLGKKYVYSPRTQKNRLSERLNYLVIYRNKLSHPRGLKTASTYTDKLSKFLSDIIRGAIRLVQDLVQSKAVPRIAVIDEEVRDRIGRLSYKLLLDDGASARIHSNKQLKLDSTFLYFGSASNPRPVDPLMVDLNDIGEVH